MSSNIGNTILNKVQTLKNIYAVMAEKGGVGKTTMVLHLASALMRRGKRVLIVDSDYQCTLSKWCFGKERAESLPVTLNDVLHDDVDPKSAVYPWNDGDYQHPRGLVDVIPGHMNLSRTFGTYLPGKGKDGILYLKRAITSISSYYDFVIIDSPPTITTQTLSVLRCADFVILITDCEPASLDGVLDFPKKVKALGLPKENLPVFLGIVLNKYSDNLSDPKEVLRELLALQNAPKLLTSRPIWKTSAITKLYRNNSSIWSYALWDNPYVGRWEWKSPTSERAAKTFGEVADLMVSRTKA